MLKKWEKDRMYSLIIVFLVGFANVLLGSSPDQASQRPIFQKLTASIESKELT
jgi:hypothetical protein